MLPLITGQGREHHGEILENIATLADQGALTPMLDPRTFSLASSNEAHLAVEDGTARGKIVVEIP